MLAEAKEKLKQEINALENETVIQNLLMYIMGMRAQSKIQSGTHSENSTAQT